MYSRSSENRDFPAFPHTEEAKLDPGWATELAQQGQDEENGFNRCDPMYNLWCPGSHIGDPGLDGVEGVLYDRALGLRCSPDGSRSAHAALRAPHCLVVVDGTQGQKYPMFLPTYGGRVCVHTPVGLRTSRLY